jgi:hypothetical protein
VVPDEVDADGKRRYGERREQDCGEKLHGRGAPLVSGTHGLRVLVNHNYILLYYITFVKLD